MNMDELEPLEARQVESARGLEQAAARVRFAPNDRAARNRLAALTIPILKWRTRRVLMRYAQSRARYHAEDLLQEVLLLWWVRLPRLLDSWDQARGLSLGNFFGLFAERCAISFLRSKRRSGWPERPASAEVVDEATGGHDPQSSLGARHDLTRVLDQLARQLSSRAASVVDLAILRDASVADAARQLGMSETSVYATLSRARGVARQIARDARDAREPRAISHGKQ
jgi:RNA polymerase sigma factor (sigma-70 family)